MCDQFVAPLNPSFLTPLCDVDLGLKRLSCASWHNARLCQYKELKVYHKTNTEEGASPPDSGGSSVEAPTHSMAMQETQ